MILTRLEKEQLVLDLHNQGKGTREIAREALHQVYDAIKDDIWSFVELYKLIKDAGTDQKQVKRLLEIANNDLPRVEELYKNLCREVERLTYKCRIIY